MADDVTLIDQEVGQEDKQSPDELNESIDLLEPGVLAGVEVSDQPDQELTEDEIAALKDLREHGRVRPRRQAAPAC